MSLNNISLPPSLLADLYQYALIEDKTRAAPVKAPVRHLGENNKNILVLVNKVDVQFLPDDELAFFTSVLSACGLDLSHVAIVNRQGIIEKDTPIIFEQFEPKQIILFDIRAEEMALPATPAYTVQSFGNSHFVTAPSLTDIEKSKEAKKQLWRALKQLFGL